MSPNKPAGQQTHDFGPRRFRWGPAGHFKPVGESVRQPLRRLASRYFLRLKPGSQPKDKFLCIDPPGNFPRVFDAAHLLADLPEIEQQAPILGKDGVRIILASKLGHCGKSPLRQPADPLPERPQGRLVAGTVFFLEQFPVKGIEICFRSLGDPAQEPEKFLTARDTEYSDLGEHRTDFGLKLGILRPRRRSRRDGRESLHRALNHPQRPFEPRGRADISDYADRFDSVDRFIKKRLTGTRPISP